MIGLFGLNNKHLIDELKDGKMLKQSILMILILAISLAATTASAGFVELRIVESQSFAEVIQMLLLGTSLFTFASLVRKHKK